MTRVRRYVADLVGAYADGGRSVIALPWLFAVVIAAELLQHVVEVHAGMYVSAAAAHALSNDSTRLAFGWVKMSLVYLGGFFVIRHLVVANGDAPLAPIAKALPRYLPYILYSLWLFALVVYAPSYVEERNATAVRGAVSLIQLAIEPLLIAWIVSAASDGAVRTPLKSALATGLRYVWGLALFFVGRIPINAVHQILARSAVGHDGIALWTLLVLDSISVGLLVGIIPALYVRIARYVRERRHDLAHASAP